MRNLWIVAAVMLAASSLISVSAISAAGAKADMAVRVQKVLQNDYDSRDAAFGRRDIGATLAHYAPDFVGVSSTGKTHDLAEERLDFQKTFTLPTRSSLTRSTIEKLTLAKSATEAVVAVRRHGVLVLVNSQTQGSDVLDLDGLFVDTWAKRGAHWLLVREQASTVKATMNGKPL